MERSQNSIFDDLEEVKEKDHSSSEKPPRRIKNRASSNWIRRRKAYLAAQPHTVVVSSKPKLLKHVLRAGRIMQRLQRDASLDPNKVSETFKILDEYRSLTGELWSRLSEYDPRFQRHSMDSWRVLNEPIEEKQLLARRRETYIGVPVNEIHGAMLTALKIILQIRTRVEFSADLDRMKSYAELVAWFRERLVELNNQFAEILNPSRSIPGDQKSLQGG